MTQTHDAETAQIVDAARLGAYLDEQLGGHEATAVEKHVAGFSNETFYVERGGLRYVLRRPPRGPILPTAHDVEREYRFLDAVRNTPVRAPRPLLLCTDTAVIGAPYYLMERTDGVVIRAELPAHLQSEDERRRIGEEMIDALAELHAVDWQSVGLKGRPDGYIDRQLYRWQSQADLTLGKVRDLPRLQAVGDWLRAHKPESPPATIVHGDFKLDNVMFAADAPARLVAIFDWEMATVGDPLADLGYLMHTWGTPPGHVEGDPLPVSALPGFPSREAMARRYADRTGREMRDFDFYHVLALWKLAIILEGLYVHYKEGTASNPAAADFEIRVPHLIERAHLLMEGG